MDSQSYPVLRGNAVSGHPVPECFPPRLDPIDKEQRTKCGEEAESSHKGKLEVRIMKYEVRNPSFLLPYSRFLLVTGEGDFECLIALESACKPKPRSPELNRQERQERQEEPERINRRPSQTDADKGAAD